MKRKLHVISLYFAVILLVGTCLSIVLCNIVHWLISETDTAMRITQVVSFFIAAVYVIKNVECRPLTPEEKKEVRWFRLRKIR